MTTDTDPRADQTATLATPNAQAEPAWRFRRDGRESELVSWDVLEAMPDDILVFGPSSKDWEPLSIVKERKAAKKRKRAKKKPPNSSVYITWERDPETGQFADLSTDEIVAHFKTVGIIKEDMETKEPMVKVYADDAGAPKGDAIVHYFQPLSAQTAIDVLNDSMIRPNLKVHVEKAKFKPVSSDAKKPKLPPAQAAVMRRVKQAKVRELVGWDEDPNRSVGLRIIVLKNMFHPDEAIGEDSFYEQLEEEIGLECQKIGGPIDKLTVFRGSPIGAVCVKFKEASGAERCIEALNGRWFGAKKISCEFFDGITNYKVEETEEEQKKRIESFGEWLEQS